MCTAEKPFRAAGTGLGKESLSTKLVPGKIAGSMHSNLAAKEVAITASSQAPQDLPSMSSLDINKPVRGGGGLGVYMGGPGYLMQMASTPRTVATTCKAKGRGGERGC